MNLHARPELFRALRCTTTVEGRSMKTLLCATGVAVAAGLASFPSAAAPCAGATPFTDIAAGNQFCTNIEWLKNRQISTGCAIPGQYCPVDFVTREQMAAFMNRLATALTPEATFFEDTFGVVDPNTQPVICQSAVVPAKSYPRQARMAISVEGIASATMVLGGRPVYSVDGGTTWPWPNNLAFRTGMTATAWNQLNAETPIPLAANQAYQFGIQLYLVAGAGTLTEGRCHWTLEITNANGTSSPFDAGFAPPPGATTAGDR